MIGKGKSMRKKKVLFLIHDLSLGGAEKVLVNLVNNMDKTQFDISVTALFGGGVNEQFLNADIQYRAICSKCFPGNSHVMKLFTPKFLYKFIVKENYDIVVSYLEGPCARIVSGCCDEKTKTVCWIHIEQKNRKRLSLSFRSFKEAKKCYQKFDEIVAVSQTVMQDFQSILGEDNPIRVLYNTVESDKIRLLASENVIELVDDGSIKLCVVGKLIPNKGVKRVVRIQKRLKQEGYNTHIYFLGEGPLREELEQYCKDNELRESVTFLGYQTNPYKYIAKCDLFVCASLAEGFSTAATEALIVGTPVCTVEVSGMKEMLGENNEYGIIVKNDEEQLYLGIKKLLDNPELLSYYKKQAENRGQDFSTKNTVEAVEKMLNSL